MTDNPTPTDLCGNCGHIRVRHKIGRCSMCSQGCKGFAVTPTPTEQQAVGAMARVLHDASHINMTDAPPCEDCTSLAAEMLEAIPGSSHARSAIAKGALVEDHWELCNKNQRPNASPAECDCGWAGRYRLASEDE